MARRVIGLDVGTNAVRLAEVELADVPTLRAFGQVALPLDAMREGEVVDPGAVTQAINRLFKELGLKKGEVRVGIAGPRVIVRPVDLPAMSEGDLEGALRYQAQELIPIPLEDAVLDFQVLEAVAPALVGAASGPARGDGALPEVDAVDEPAAQGMNRVLLAAAHRETVDHLVGAVRGAGLRVSSVDLVPLALIRSLGRRLPDQEGDAEAIVCVGGGVTVVVVHQGGLPRFVRMLGTGGRSLTDAVATELEVTAETAEALKRQGPSASPELAPRVQAALERPLSNLLEEVRGSVDYYRTQPDSAHLDHIVLTGGASAQTGLAEGLGRVLSLPIQPAVPRESLSVGDIGFPADQVGALDPYLPVPVGVALGGAASGKRINLLTAGRPAGSTVDTRRVVTLGVFLGLLLVIALGFLTLQKQNQVSDAKDKVAQQRSANAGVQRQIDSLASAQRSQQQVEALQAQVEGVLSTDVSWSRMLQEIARTEPNDVWLTAFQGTVTSGAGAAGSPAAGRAAGISGSTATTTAPGATPGAAGALPGAAAASAGPTGTITFTAVGLDFTSVAGWLMQVGQMPSLTALWVPTSSKTTQGTRTVVNFSSNASLTGLAQSDRLAQVKAGQR